MLFFHQFVGDLSETVFKIAAEFRTGEQQTHIEAVDGKIVDRIRHVVLRDPEREPVCDRRLSDARVSDVKRIVFRAAAQDLDRAVDFIRPPDERIDFALFCLRRQIDAKFFERRRFCSAWIFMARIVSRLHAGHEFLLPIAAVQKKLIFIRQLLGADRFDETELVDAAHTQRIRTIIAFFFRHADEHVGDVEYLPVARRAVEHGAIHHFLKALRFNGFGDLPVSLHCGHGYVFFYVFVYIIANSRHIRAARFEQIAYRIERERRTEQMLRRKKFVSCVFRIGKRNR